jgi:hypothetical protein
MAKSNLNMSLKEFFPYTPDATIQAMGVAQNIEALFTLEKLNNNRFLITPDNSEPFSISSDEAIAFASNPLCQRILPK